MGEQRDSHFCRLHFFLSVSLFLHRGDTHKNIIAPFILLPVIMIGLNFIPRRDESQRDLPNIVLRGENILLSDIYFKIYIAKYILHINFV